MRNLKVETDSNGQESYQFVKVTMIDVEDGVLYCIDEDVKSVIYAPGQWVSAVLEADDANENA